MTLPLSKWTNQRLIHQLMLALSVGLMITIFLTMVLFNHIYHRQLVQEYQVVTQRVNRLLQALLENVMLQSHDLNSLGNLIAKLAQHQEIHQALLMSSHQMHKFSSTTQPNPIFSHSSITKNSSPAHLILATTIPNSHGTLQLIMNEQGTQILRQITPLFENNSVCIDCHSVSEKTSMNDILLIDYDAQIIQQRVWQHNWPFFVSIAAISLLNFLMMSWIIYYLLLQPLYNLLVLSKKLIGLDNLTDPLSETKLTQPQKINEINEINEFNQLKQTLFQLTQKITDSQHREYEQYCFFHSLINAIPDGIRVISSDYTIVVANQAYHQQLGWPAAHSLHQPCYVSSHARSQPCSYLQGICTVHEILTHRQPIKIITEHVCADGRQLPVEICAAPMFIEENGQQQIYVVESVRDLTNNCQISQTQKLSVIGQMAASIAHDIKTPLSSIRLALQATLRNLNTPQPNLAQTRHYLQLVDKQIDKCITITQRLLKLSTPDEEQPQLICLNQLIVETVTLLAFEAKERKIKINHDFKNTNYHLIATETDIRILMINLLHNAFNAMPQGGKIQITLSRCQHQIQMSIQDTGIGIHPNMLDNIFEPFFSRRADGKKGAGLGLSICKTIVERYQGHIAVNQSVQRGCQFLVTLPETHQKKTSEVA